LLRDPLRAFRECGQFGSFQALQLGDARQEPARVDRSGKTWPNKALAAAGFAKAANCAHVRFQV